MSFVACDTPKYSLKENEAEARERIRAFWAGSSLGRPAIHATVRRPDFEPAVWEGEKLSPKEKDLSAEFQSFTALNALQSEIYLAEAMPGYAIRVDTHIPLLAALVGGEYEYVTDEDWWGGYWGGTAWIQPWPEIFEQPLPKFDATDPFVEALTKVTQGVADFVGSLGIVSPPCYTDALSTLGALRKEQQLCADICLEPDPVIRWTQAATQLIIDSFEHFYAVLAERGYGECVSWLPLLAEGKMDSVQCDFSIMLSPDQYNEFVAPDLEKLTLHFDYSYYHLDGHDNMRFLNTISSLKGLGAIQYTRVAGSDYPGYCLDDYREIRRRGLSLYAHCMNVDEAVETTKTVGPDGLFLALPQFSTVDEAEKAIRAIERAC